MADKIEARIEKLRADLRERPNATNGYHLSTWKTFTDDMRALAQGEPGEAQKREAVLSAAREWSAERAPSDWCEADLMKAIIVMEGDWPGCDECDHQCDEPCAPATVEEMLSRVDSHIADLVHSGKLGAYIGYAPPEGWKPTVRIKRLSPTASAPAAEREPLTDDEMWNLWNAQGSDCMDQAEATAFARAIEKAHGIGTKEPTNPAGSSNTEGA